MTIQECYRILGVSPGVTVDEVKSSFRKLAFKLHPDLNPSPDAQQEFQRLNEAYVLLKTALEEEPPPRPGKTGTTERPGKPKASPEEGAKAYGKQQTTGARPGGPSPGADTASSRKRFYYRKEEVLKDILNDPFARQVFEDIYQHIKRDRPGYTPPKEPLQRNLQVNLGKRNINIDLSRGPLTRAKDWLKGQLDDEQTVTFPAHLLIPGRTVRLEISRRFPSRSKTIEVRLPADFKPGRPIRLRGLGRRLGSLRGDLFLRVIGK